MRLQQHRWSRWRSIESRRRCQRRPAARASTTPSSMKLNSWSDRRRPHFGGCSFSMNWTALSTHPCWTRGYVSRRCLWPSYQSHLQEKNLINNDLLKISNMETAKNWILFSFSSRQFLDTFLHIVKDYFWDSGKSFLLFSRTLCVPLRYFHTLQIPRVGIGRGGCPQRFGRMREKKLCVAEELAQIAKEWSDLREGLQPRTHPRRQLAHQIDVRETLVA